MYLKIAIATLITLLLAAVLGLGKLYVSSQTESALRLDYIEQLQGEIVTLNIKIIDETKEQAKVVIKKETINASFREARSELLKQKGKTKEVVLNPTATKNAVQASYDTFMIDIQCLTGDVAKCVK